MKNLPIPKEIHVVFRPTWGMVWSMVWRGLLFGSVRLVIPNPQVINYEEHLM